MSAKERRRIGVLEKVKAGELSLRQAAAVMRVSYRQAKRLRRRFDKDGDAGLVHCSRGKPGRRSKPPAERVKILQRYKERYADFGPTLAAEHLEKEGLRVDHETLRRWLLKEGVWKARRTRQKHRQWRERKECFGEMVQMDGSHHDWFEGRRGRAVLMVMIDDATNRTEAWFSEEETTRASFDVFESWTQQHGIPASLYVDRDSIYRCDREQTVAEQIAGTEPLTQFGRAMEDLGVRLILANSPQAKGRVERRNAVFQDRLVKEMRLEGISDLKAANEYLRRRFLPQLNRRFALAPKAAADAHRKALGSVNEALSWQEERVVQKDWTVVWRGRWFQIGRSHESLSLAGKKITMRELRDGRVDLLHKGQRRRCHELPGRPTPKKPAPASREPRKVTQPGAAHPWRGTVTGKEFWKKEKARGALVKREARQAVAGSVLASLRSASTPPATA